MKTTLETTLYLVFGCRPGFRHLDVPRHVQSLDQGHGQQDALGKP